MLTGKTTQRPELPFEVVHWPPTRHHRNAGGELVDTVRHLLLRILVGRIDPDTDDDLGPWERGMTQRELRRREWHAIACAIGDLLDNLRSVFAVAGLGVLIILVGAALAVYAPLWATVPAFAVLVLWCAWRLGVANRRGGAELTEVLEPLDIDDDATVQLPVVQPMQGKEKWA